MTERNDGGPAFPHSVKSYHENHEGTVDVDVTPHPGNVSLRDYFAAAALSNPALCTGEAPEWQLRNWFGDRGGIARREIVAKQADEYADAMLAERERADQ